MKRGFFHWSIVVFPSLRRRQTTWILDPGSGAVITRRRDLVIAVTSRARTLAGMEIEAVPEPSDDERAALLEALRPAAGSAPAAYSSEWRRAALREAADADEP